MTSTLDKYREILREDFCAFVGRTFRELNAAEDFSYNWHLDAIAAKLEQVRRGEVKRLIVNLPPRQGKSIIGSIAFPAFLLGHNPQSKLLCVSYSQDLAETLAEQSRILMNSPFYQALFDTRLSQTRQSIDDYQTTSGGYRLSRSLTGGITGRGADIIIIDDPIKADDAQSQARRDAANVAFYNTIYSRLNNKQKGAIVIIMQRLHVDDFVGYVQQRDTWDLLKLPAIATESEVYDIRTPYGAYRVERHKGDALHPAREPLSVIEKLRQATSEYIFSAQYQQEPQPPAGLIVKADWLQFYEPTEMPNDGLIVQSWDTANKDTETSNFSVCTTWRYQNRNFWLLDVYRGRLNFPQLKGKAIELARRFGAETILVEDKASGTQLIQELREVGIAATAAPSSTESKAIRLANQTAKFESGFIHLPRRAPWLDGFVAELTGFPNTQFDDQVDSVVHALAWDTEREGGPGVGLLHYYEQEAAKLGSRGEIKEESQVRVRSRTNGTIYLLSGRPINVAEGQELTLSEEDARPLFGPGIIERVT